MFSLNGAKTRSKTHLKWERAVVRLTVSIDSSRNLIYLPTDNLQSTFKNKSCLEVQPSTKAFVYLQALFCVFPWHQNKYIDVRKPDFCPHGDIYGSLSSPTAFKLSTKSVASLLVFAVSSTKGSQVQESRLTWTRTSQSSMLPLLAATEADKTPNRNGVYILQRHHDASDLK